MPIGGENMNNKVKESSGKMGIVEGKGKSHLEIAQMFDLLDFQSASKITGNKFVFLKNEAA